MKQARFELWFSLSLAAVLVLGATSQLARARGHGAAGAAASEPFWLPTDTLLVARDGSRWRLELYRHEATPDTGAVWARREGGPDANP